MQTPTPLKQAARNAKAKQSSANSKDAVRAKAQRKKAPASAPPAEDSAARSPKAQRTRERLLEAAKKVFEEQGFLNARISDIAERADQSHGSFYYYFDSKEEIFRELAAALDESLFAPLDDVILAQSGRWPAPVDRIREATRRYLESSKRDARMLDLIEQVSRYDPEVNAMRLARHKRNTERVAASIRQMQQHGMADQGLDAYLAATALGALTQRFAELWFAHGAVSCTLERGVEQLSRIYENALQIKRTKGK